MIDAAAAEAPAPAEAAPPLLAEEIGFVEFDPYLQTTTLAGKVDARDERDERDELVLERYKRGLNFPQATCTIEDLRLENGAESQPVTVYGYMGTRADLSKNLSFFELLDLDLTRSVQVVSSLKPKSLGGDGEVIGGASGNDDGSAKANAGSHYLVRKLQPYTPVVVTGILCPRKAKASESVPASTGSTTTPNTTNTAVTKNNTLEIHLASLISLNNFPENILAQSDTNFPPEQRHLELRTQPSLRSALHFRARVNALCRDELARKQGFLEVETPILFKSTPEGAREFVVPTRRKGLAYALPQSPQQYKQILMGSGVRRYFQVARCFRDEDLRADRQPEFTQLDLEMSFATGEQVMQVIEALIRRLWKELLGIDLVDPFPRMPYRQAMTRYGSDKPDIRLPTTIMCLDKLDLVPENLRGMISDLPKPIVDGMIFRLTNETPEHGVSSRDEAYSEDVDPRTTQKFIRQFMDSPEAEPFNKNPEGQPGIFIIDSRKPLQGLQAFGFEHAEKTHEALNLLDGDLLILQARANKTLSGGSTPLGNLRLALHRFATKQGYIDPPTGFAPLWITDFPLFTPSSTADSEPGQRGAAGLSSTHHPFTSPKTAADVDLLLTNPERVIGEHYDIVMNGIELGGGSRRIHDAAMQRLVMEKVLKMSEARIDEFAHLLEVLRAGCPPHAGIALGFDRLVAVMLRRESVRDVIAFPKGGRGEDPLVGSPGVLGREVLDTYHLRLKERE
ncbi:hypothetical protein MMC25_007237 [Agyrium rufum]|nr:hypothetical protein [Agyrium rufum]